MKNKVIAFLFLLLPMFYGYSYSMEEFKQLSPEKQVHLWLETYKNDPNCFSRLRYAQTVGYFGEPEMISVFKPLLIKELQQSHITKWMPYDFDMISQLLYQRDYFSCLTTAEKETLAELLYFKLNVYVSEIKAIDSEVLYYTVIAKKFRDNLDYFPDYENPNTLLQYYEDQGISGLTIDWADIEEHYHISRE